MMKIQKMKKKYEYTPCHTSSVVAAQELGLAGLAVLLGFAAFQHIRI